MNNNIHNSLVRELNKDAAYAVLNSGSDRCKWGCEDCSRSDLSESTCQCGRCSLARSVRRGVRLAALEKKRNYEALKIEYAPPLALLQIFGHDALTKGITILFFSVTLSLPFALNRLPNTGTESLSESDSGYDITEGLIARAVPQPPEAPLPRPSPAIGVKNGTNYVKEFHSKETHIRGNLSDTNAPANK